MISGFGGVEIKEESKAKGEWDSSINHSAYWVNFSALFKRWGRKPTNIFNFTVMVERGGQ
jgi:hypothetical protein